MEYITVHEASLKWGINVRQVQKLCERGSVEGVIRFNRSWAIPASAEKPKDKRCRKKDTTVEETVGGLAFFNQDSSLFKEIIDFFPYSVNVTDTEGVMVYANQSFFVGTLEEARNNSIGNYNIFHEEMLEKWGLKEHIEKAFRGEKVCTPNLKLAYREAVDKYGKDYAFVSIFHDVTSFPIFDDDKQLQYVVTVFIPVRKYMGRDEIIWAREYLENHWEQPYDAKLVAQAAKLSVSRLQRLFKEHTGFSPHDYYTDIKMKHLKEALLNFSISVSQAFYQCGMDYNSYYATLFKKHAGLTPTEFRNRYL